MKTIATLAVLVSSIAFAQTPPNNIAPTQQTATHADACTTINATGGINTATTLTITAPGPGLYIYVCEIDLTVSNNATGAVTATNLSFTTSNLGGWKYTYSMVGTANTVPIDRSFSFYPGCIKATVAATAVTIVPPAANAQAVYNINACYYSAG